MRISTLVLLLSIALSAFSQPEIPENGTLFLQDEVATVYITLEQEELDDMLLQDNWYSNEERLATFVYEYSGGIDTVENVGFRLRGNTSRSAAKKSFKVSFNTFTEGAKYHGVEKLNLNGEHNDPSILRSKLNWDLIRHYELTGSRTSYVRLYVNGEYKGLYLNVEHIDENFVDKYFDNGTGNLFKCLWPATLEYLGSDPDSYKVEVGGRRVYDLKTNTEEDDYSDIAHFMDVLNNTDIADLPCELEKVFNVADYLKLLAIEVLIGHWDGYSVNKNNFYIYHNQKTDRFEYIHYDLDNTCGIDWFNVDWSTRDVYNWSSGSEYRPLYERIMEVPEYRNQYSHWLDIYSQEYFNPDSLSTQANYWQSLVEDAALEDEYRTWDYGFDDNAFLNSLTEAWGNHVTQGIIEYVEDRYESLGNQLDDIDDFATLNYGRDNSPEIETLDFRVTSEGLVNWLELHYRINEGNWQTVEMWDHGLNGDDIAGDGNWYRSFSLADWMLNIEYQFVAYTDFGEVSYPCEPVWIWTSSLNNGLFVNEVMAINNSTNWDESGMYEDWIEVYSNADTPIFLGDYYLTDDIDNPDRWQMPEVTINPGQFELFWCDKDLEEGNNHTNFKLSGSGEDAAIFTLDQGAWRVVDFIQFGPQTADISYGREFDADPDWVLFDEPTPDGPNGFTSVDETSKELPRVYPNPTADLLFFGEASTGVIVDMSGRRVTEFQNVWQIDLTNFAPGLYSLVIENQTVGIIKR